jgi:hypothetical protein
MKPVVLLLLLASVSANAVWWLRPALISGSAASAQHSTHDDAVSAASTDAPANTSGPTPAGDAPLPPALLWTSLPAGDLQALADHLRAHNVPPHIIRGVVGYYLNEEYKPRRQALRDRITPTQYWKQNMYSRSNDAGIRTEWRALMREQGERLNALSGTSESFIDPYSSAMMRQRYGNLSPERIEMVQAIESDYSELMMQVREASQGLILREDREALALLEQEKRKDLLAVMSPEEYEELELRTSSTAHSLRRSLVTLEPSEAEFRAIHRLQLAFDEKYNATSARRNDRAFLVERQAAERDLVAAIKAELGEERGAEYEKTRDFSYVHAHTVAKGLGLPKETGDRLWSVQKNAMQQFNEAGRGGSNSPAERTQRLLGVVNAAKAAIAAEIGEENLQTYQQGGGGWLRSFEQMATRTPGPAPARPATP